MAYEGWRQVFGPLLRKKIRHIKGEENLPPQPPFILAPNHVGFLDPLVLVTYMYDRYHRRTLYLTAPKMWFLWGPYLARHWLGMIPIYKSRIGDSLIEAKRALRQGEIVGIFPEGKRNAGKHLIPGKTGAVRLALNAKVPIIPVGLNNNTGFHIGKAFRSLWQSDKYIDITFGRTLDFSEFDGKEADKPLLEAATHKLMMAISQVCGKEYPFKIEN